MVAFLSMVSTTRVDGLWTLVHFLTPKLTGVKKCTRVDGPSTRAVNSGSGNWALLPFSLVFHHTVQHVADIIPLYLHRCLQLLASVQHSPHLLSDHVASVIISFLLFTYPLFFLLSLCISGRHNSKLDRSNSIFVTLYFFIFACFHLLSS